ncbi:MAG: hypothetical protein LC099_02325 [Anaerolineales bacterium]|nr:hypothetical protein [Anaerolineales bacterium]
MRTKPIRFLLTGGTLALIAFFAALFFLPKPQGTGLTVNKDVPFYSMPWNDNPFFPGLINTADGKMLDGANVPSAEFCAQCHEKEYREWASSVHSDTGLDLLYDTAANNNEVAHKNRNGLEKTRWCESCHEPVNLLRGEVNPLAVVGPSQAAKEGTTCVVCHTAVKADPLAGNGAVTLDLNNLNNYNEALIMAAPSEHARNMQSKTHNPLMGSSDFCGACHTEIRPVEINGGDPLHLQSTYEEWQKSEYAEKNIQCQDCHMPPDPAAFIAELNETGKTPKRVVSHRFVGVNYLLTDPTLPSNLTTFLRGGLPPGGISLDEWKADLLEQQRLTLDLIKSAATLSVSAPASVSPNATANLDVTIVNSGAGHSLPTGALDQRHMWLEVKATDATGKVIYDNGWFDEKTGKVDPSAVIYIKVLVDKNDDPIYEHILFNVKSYSYTRDPIPANASDTIPYAIPIPADAQGTITVQTTLWYRLALQEFVTYSLKLDMILPPVMMAQNMIEIPAK